MANDASVTVQATVLPDEIAKVISGSLTVSPADADDKWYYKKTVIANSSGDLIDDGTNFIEYTARADGAITSVHVDDKVKFLLVKNMEASGGADVYIVADNTAATTSNATAIKVAGGQIVCVSLPNTVVANIHAISSTGTPTCIVAALIEDVA